MSQIEESTDNAAVIIADDSDVEGHGLREVAVGLAVTATVIGGAAAASAVSPGTPSVGGAIGTVSTTADGALRGSGLETGKAIAKQAKIVTDPATAAGYSVDSTVVATQGTVSSTTATAIATVDATTASTVTKVGELAEAALSDLGTIVGAANNLVTAATGAATSAINFLQGVVDQKVVETKATVDQTKKTADELAAAVVTDVDRTKTAAVLLAEQQADEVRRMSTAAVEAAAALANQKLTEAQTAVQNTIVLADEAAKATMAWTTATLRSAANDAQVAAGSAIGTATAVPGTAMNTVIGALQDTKQKWDAAVNDLTVPDAAGAVDAIADDVDAAVNNLRPGSVIAPAMS